MLHRLLRYITNTNTDHVQAFSGRKFSGTEVIAYVQTVRERYRKSGTQRDALEGIDTEAEEQKRLERYGDFLEGKGT
jgi:HIV Tat-specific factor 1